MLARPIAGQPEQEHSQVRGNRAPQPDERARQDGGQDQIMPHQTASPGRDTDVSRARSLKLLLQRGKAGRRVSAPRLPAQKRPAPGARPPQGVGRRSHKVPADASTNTTKKTTAQNGNGSGRDGTKTRSRSAMLACHVTLMRTPVPCRKSTAGPRRRVGVGSYSQVSTAGPTTLAPKEQIAATIAAGPAESPRASAIK